ncbi:MT-A70-domain-containing protein [Trematosphaeria pertusa]|uniref:MT-A70-domain-containing protein n=1 Tax=Trematosphaeria pertusa TaxID=390896 RepID=A0A6A6IYH8_9PLEO|nr:MT-A70-domain-containing protein [Trematosphaeria pertusa]KAF2255621.1 MT-A70-domain-containing protein [Trematosphaeria pertusa]
MSDPIPGGIQRTAILYQNANQDIILIDIPKSIAVAQRRSGILLSSSPLEAPIPLHDEPTPEKAKAHKARHLLNPDLHADYKVLIEQALAEICNHVSGPWCRPRQLMAHVPKPGKTDMHIDDPEKELESRLREWAALGESKGEDSAFDFQKMMASLGTTSGPNATSSGTVTHKWLMSYGPAREIKGDAQRAKAGPQSGSEEPWMAFFHNPEDHALDLAVFGSMAQSPEYRFTIPPRATFFLSDSTHSDAFRASFRELTDEYTLPRHFDLVLLDPPWPNRSAKRKGAYEQVGGMPHVKKMLLNMDIDSYFEHNALVGVWITNKEALRAHVLGPGGLFEKWNVGLIEEWVWIKTTTHGEPMFNIDSLLRKPYEILLLGRAAPNSWTTMAPAPFIKKRVIAAVPDIHSRKPCLKELLEPYMPDINDYSALEIFSRYLVAGWTSWGNEVLKYNWDQYWASAPGSERSSADTPSR